ncbi:MULTISPECIES: ABC transporter ATP-binding protein [unclassified Enterococcus]|uniref:ABC transporter ATP-binding protein n=1 Tax=unclassified Enterococcus TaxID=2608891 RepID=UPI001CE0EE8F|nr:MULTISPECIES: ABC transporter ATP-binding protein [unclassified Enterococcus]MCA5012059.1 ABC transporter ATP-binding protein [Enterococcus sp. S23]MCA5015310.1 ABC transporter ATP-binding protein [Enterococcus sp. S22(2020)]
MSKGTPMNRGVKATPKDLSGTFKRLMSYMKESLWLIVLVAVIAIAGTLLQVLSPKLLGSATTLIFAGVKAKTGIDFTKLAMILGIVGAMYVGKAIADFVQQWLMTVVSQNTTKTLRNELKAKINELPSDYFDKHSNGNLMSIAINDMDNIATMLQQSLTQLLSSVILVIGVIWLMLTISWKLTLVAALILPCSFLITKLFTPKAQENFKKYLHVQGSLNGQIEEAFNGHTVIKSFNYEEKSEQQFEAFNKEMYEAGWKSKFFGGSMMPAMILLKNLVYVVICTVGAVEVAAGAILIGNLQAFLQYSTQFSQPISQFSQIWSGILSIVASAERVFEVLDEEERKHYEQTFPDQLDDSAKVRFDHVQFGYGEELLMKDFSLAVAPKETIAIVGHTGAGKTTLVHLLQRFYEISGGSIKIDGIDSRNFTHEQLHQKIGMVLQDTWLFSGTIYDNIKYGNPDATKEQVYAAAKAAFVDEFVRKLPEGYETVLNEETNNISQGQRQLITIARAFLANPEILILDEATSNVDTRTEMLIQKAMKQLLVGRTSFVVAHRLSTIYDADKIIVMDQGDVVESGNHQELLEAEGVYSDIYNSQFLSDVA